MRVLIVCYCYPPDPGPRAYRWSAIAEHWAAGGHHVDVISGRKAGAAGHEIRNGVEVHRVRGGLAESLRFHFERRARRNSVDGGGCPRDEALGGARLSSVGGVLKRVHDLTWKNLYWPDSACLWFLPAWTKAKRLLERNDYDAIISTSTPYTGHLVGQRIKRLRPGLVWLVDLGDPFSFYDAVPWNNRFLFDRLNRRSERAVLDRADAVSLTVRACLEEYERRFPGVAGKARVIPPVLDLPREPGPARRPPPPAGAKRLVFAGTLYRGIRNPGFYLRLLSRLFERRPGIEAHFYGRLNDCVDAFEPYQALLDKGIFLHGPVDRAAALAAVRAADVLVNIGNATAYQLPSKIVEYASTGKPILNLVSLDADCSMEFLRGYPAALSLVQSATGPSEADVARLARFIAVPPTVSLGSLASFLEPYRVETVARAYLDLIAGGAERPARRLALP